MDRADSSAPDSAEMSSAASPSTKEPLGQSQVRETHLQEIGDLIQALGAHDAAQVTDGLAGLKRLYADYGRLGDESVDATRGPAVAACLAAAQRLDISPKLRKELLAFARAEGRYPIVRRRKSSAQLLLEFLENAYASAEAGTDPHRHLLLRDGQPVILSKILDDPGEMVELAVYSNGEFRVYEVTDADGNRYLIKLWWTRRWETANGRPGSPTPDEVETALAERRSVYSLLRAKVPTWEFGENWKFGEKRYRVIIPDTDFRIFKQGERLYFQETSHLGRDWLPWLQDDTIDFAMAEDSVMLGDVAGLRVRIEELERDYPELELLKSASWPATQFSSYYVLPDTLTLALVNWWG